jgi:hypothetical protein
MRCSSPKPSTAVTGIDLELLALHERAQCGRVLITEHRHCLLLPARPFAGEIVRSCCACAVLAAECGPQSYSWLGSGIAWGKTDEQKAADAAAREAARAEAAQQKAAAAYWASPVGRADAARRNGNAFFQIELEISSLAGTPSALGSSSNQIKHTGGRPDLLGQIEDLGWRLEHVGYVFVETGSTSTNRVMSTGQGTVTRGSIVGVYLFRAS